MIILPEKVVRNFGVGLLGKLLSQAISFTLVVYLARVLGPASYGSINMALAIISYFNLVAAFGLPTVGTREIARKQTDRVETISCIYSLRICLAAAAYLLLLVYAYIFVDDGDLFYFLLLYGLTILSSSWFLDWAAVGLEDLRLLTVANLLGNCCTGILVFLFVKEAADVFYVPLSLFTGAVLACVLLLYFLYKSYWLRLRFTLAKGREVLQLAMPFAITSALSQVYENFDMIFLGMTANYLEVGYYSVAYKIVSVLSGIIGIYSQAVLPVMIRLRSENASLAGHVLQNNVQAILFLMLPIVTGGTLLGGAIIDTFFGEMYANAAPAFVLLLYYVLFMALSITLANWLIAVNEDRQYMKILLCGAVLNVVMNLLLTPIWKSTGAAMAMIITEVFVFAFFAWKIKGLQRGFCLDGHSLLVLVGSCLGMGAGIVALQQVFNLHVAFLIVIGAMLYLGLAWPVGAKIFRKGFAGE